MWSDLRTYLAGAALLAGGCSAATADLRLQLITLAGDQPFVGLATFDVTVEAGDETVHERVPFDGGQIWLASVERDGPVEIEVVGLDPDAAVLSRGRARPELPDRGGDCCVLLCFCTTARFDAGECSCGEDSCAADCDGR